jgi:3-oxoacyl-[acyl-carrier-protein] synthase III
MIILTDTNHFFPEETMMLPLNYLCWLHERVKLVPLADLADLHDLGPGQIKVLQRFYSIKSVAKHPSSHKEMFSEVIQKVIEENNYLIYKEGLLIYAKTQTHNTFYDDNWLSELAQRHSIGHWDSATLSLNHCATALSAIHFLKGKAKKEKKPIILLTGEKAFHKDINKLDNGLLAEIPVALLLNSGQKAEWTISDSFVMHLADFHNNHRDKPHHQRRELFSTLDNHYIEFYQALLKKFKLELDDIDAIVPCNLDLPQLRRVFSALNYQGEIFIDALSHYGHAYCSDIPFNLCMLLNKFRGKRVLCVTMGMGITLSGILIERDQSNENSTTSY